MSKYRERALDLKNPLDMLRFIIIHPFSFPGCYELCAITKDGGFICSVCVKENYQEMFSATKREYENYDPQWEITDIIADCELENAYCSHCGKEIGYHEEKE